MVRNPPLKSYHRTKYLLMLWVWSMNRPDCISVVGRSLETHHDEGTMTLGISDTKEEQTFFRLFLPRIFLPSIF